MLNLTNLHLVGLRTTVALGALSLVFGCGDDSGDASGGGGPSGVEIALSCEMPSDCGGDPIGTWELVSACTEAPENGFECDSAVRPVAGTVSGTYTLEEGSIDYEVDTELRQCGWIDSGSASGGGSLVIEGNTLDIGGTRTATFCVEGDTLWIQEDGLTYPDLTVMRLARAAGDAGTN